MSKKQSWLCRFFIASLLFVSVGCDSSSSSDFLATTTNGTSGLRGGSNLTGGSGNGLIPGPGTGVPVPFNPTSPDDVVVPPASQPPTAVDDVYSIEQGNTLIQTTVTGVTANDIVRAGEVTFPTATVEGGTLVGQTNGSFVYVPASGFVGTDSFHYDLANSAGASTGQVTITVNPRIFRAVSVTPGGTAANNSGVNGRLAISGDGGLVAFTSGNTDLDPPDTNGYSDFLLADTVLNIISRISNTPAGVAPNGFTSGGDMTPDGNLLVYDSRASDIVPGDTNNVADIFLFNRTTGVTERVSLDSSGLQLTEGSTLPSISDDGRFVVFDAAGPPQTIKLRDRVLGTTTVVSLGPLGVLPDENLTLSSRISGDGQWVAMYSRATNLVVGDTNGHLDVFLYSVADQTLQLISRVPNGPPSDGDSRGPDINFDGSLVVFESEATNLVAGDTNGYRDCFLFDRVANTLVRVSTKPSGEQIPKGAGQPAISPDGMYVSWESSDTTILADPTSLLGEVFVKDLPTGNVAVISRGPNNEQGNGQGGGVNYSPFSDDGHFLAFVSSSSNWIPGDSTGMFDVFEVTNPFYRP